MSLNFREPLWTQLPTGRVTYFDSDPSSERVPIVLLHGGGLDCASLSWRELFPELATRFRVIAPNWPGYGGSAPFGRNYQIGDLGHWLVGFLDTLGVSQASFVGISMGGGAALWMAINAPHRVDKLVPVGTYGIADRAPFHLISWMLTKLPLNEWSYALMKRSPKLLDAALRQIFLDPTKLTSSISDEVLEVLRNSADGRSFSHFQRGETRWTGLNTVFTSQLHQIVSPTLLIHGKGDALVPVEAVKSAAKQIPNAKVEIMDAGHWPMRECPEDFNTLVGKFLSDMPRDE